MAPPSCTTVSALDSLAELCVDLPHVFLASTVPTSLAYLSDDVQYYARYPEGVSDYCITVDSEFVIDGAARALDRENFSCCHINHSSTRFNVSRRTLPREQCVQIFTNQDIRCMLPIDAAIMAAWALAERYSGVWRMQTRR